MDTRMTAQTGGARKLSGWGWSSRRRFRGESASMHYDYARLARAEAFKKRDAGKRHQKSAPTTPVYELPTLTTELELTEPNARKELRVLPSLLGLVLIIVLIIGGKLPPPTHEPQTSLMSSLAHLLTIAVVVSAVRILAGLVISKKVPQKQDTDMKKVMGAALLVAGGTVGAGIVALPVKTAAVGLLPSMAGLLAGWGYMLLNACAIVEVSEHCGGGNFTSMADRTLGRRWKAVSVALYIFVYCTTLTAYIAESATFLGPAAAMILGWAPPPAVLSLIFTVVFGGVIARGSRAVDAINSACVMVALAAFLLLMVFGGTGLSSASLLYCKWGEAIGTAPIMVVAFTFHNMVPSLMSYLQSGAAVRRALVIGTSIPLAMYLVWEALILGSLPPGSSLASVGEIMGQMGGTGAIPAAINTFSLFAIITSFLGAGMGCLDFILDLAGRSGKGQDSLRVLAVMMGVPLAIASFAPQLFVTALEVSGVLRLVLFAIIPGLMLRAGNPRGRKGWLGLAVITFAMVIIGIDIAGRLPPLMR